MRDEELTAAIREVRARARARTPDGNLGLEGVVPPDLTPLLQARDAAEAKVAAIGTVNPRPPGLKNSLAQSVKRLIARALDWHVREQVEFNRGAMACVNASLEALADASRAVAALAAHHRQLREDLIQNLEAIRRDGSQQAQQMEDIRRHWAQQMEDIRRNWAQQMEDIRRHWAEWRPAFEERRSASEIHILRTISELQGAFQHRVTLLEQNYRETVRHQHSDFTAALERNTLEIQQRLSEDLAKVRSEFEKLIYTELRLYRQRQSLAPAPPAPPPSAAMPPEPAGEVHIDWMRFAETFRGSEDRIREQQGKYAARFTGAVDEILDVGCGRGEFLEAARDAGLPARGIDLSQECVALCRSKGLQAERADLFDYLANLPARSLGGIFCSQVVEHLPPERVPALVQLFSEKLRPGALVAIETPNPQCLAIFATHFYIDPTHTRPVPAPLLRFYLEEAGFANVEIERLEPAVESMPALVDLPASVRDTFFGSLDYAIFARKL